MRAVLGPLGVELLDRPADVADVEETGDTLEDERALEGARARRERPVCAAIADDTGLFVDALDGRPGVRSARYAGEAASYDDNVTKLLAELDGGSRAARRAFRHGHRRRVSRRFDALRRRAQLDGVDRAIARAVIRDLDTTRSSCRTTPAVGRWPNSRPRRRTTSHTAVERCARCAKNSSQDKAVHEDFTLGWSRDGPRTAHVSFGYGHFPASGRRTVRL